MKRLLLGYDGSDPAKRAARLAGYLASRLGAAVTVLTVGQMVTAVGGPVVPTVAEVVFEPTADEGAQIVRAHGVDTEARVEIGDPASIIIQTAARDRYDLVIMGHRGLGGIKEMVLGSVAKRVATEASCPVLVVRGVVPETIKKILVAVDGSAPAQRAVEAAAVLARALAARITLLHVIDLAALAMQPRGEARDQLRNSLRQEGLEALAKATEICERKGAGCTSAQVEGSPAEVIRTWVRVRHYGLVAVGRRGMSGIARFALGSVSDEVLAKANRSVLVAGEQTVAPA